MPNEPKRSGHDKDVFQFEKKNREKNDENDTFHRLIDFPKKVPENGERKVKRKGK